MDSLFVTYTYRKIYSIVKIVIKITNNVKFVWGGQFFKLIFIVLKISVYNII